MMRNVLPTRRLVKPEALREIQKNEDTTFALDSK
jgi:hypothetical protein